MIRKQGDFKNPERNDLIRQIWKFAMDRNIWLSTQHIPGIENEEADEASRYFRDAGEYGIKPHIRDYIFTKWGTPEIDLFATNRNNVLPRFGSWGPDPEAEHIDSFQVNWGRFQSVYIFPPHCLISRVIQKIIIEGAEGILIVPDWPRKYWYPQLRKIELDYDTFPCENQHIYLSVETDLQLTLIHI